VIWIVLRRLARREKQLQTTDWLLSTGNPAVRYLAAESLVTPRPAQAQLDRMRAEALKWAPLRQIVGLQSEDGSFPGRDSRGRAEATVNALHLMARCRMRAGDDPVDRALAYVKEHCTFQGAYSWVKGGSGVLPCYVGLFARTLIRLAGAEAAASNLSWICDHQRFDHRGTRGGGAKKWPYRAVESYGGCWRSVSCYHGVVAALSALAAVPPEARSETIRVRISQAVEYLRVHRVCRKGGADKLLFRHLTQYFLVGGHRLHLIDVLEALSMADPSLGEADWVAEAMQAVESTLLDGKVPLVKNYPSKLIDPVPLETVGEPCGFLTVQWLLVKQRFGPRHA